MMAGRKPNYNVGALNKRTDEKNSVGVGWANDNGSISIRLDPFITLTSSPDLVITLFIKDKDNGRP